MIKPVIDHIQITVKDMGIAEPFYDKFLSLLGFDLINKVSAVIKEHDFYVVEYSHPLLSFAITSPRKVFMGDTINRRKPGSLHHLAFKAASRDEVDRLYNELEKIGAQIVSRPTLYPAYSPDYYAVFLRIWRALNTKLFVINHQYKTVINKFNDYTSLLFNKQAGYEW